MSEQQHLTTAQVHELNERFGWFENGDAQGDVSRDFAQAAIEKYEQMRSAAPLVLAALERICADLRTYTLPINESGDTVADVFAAVLKEADEALTAAGAA